MDDSISRHAAIEALKKISFSQWFEFGEYPSEDTREIEIINSNKAFEAIKALPPAQPEPSIPISQIEKQINWLKSMNNRFSDIVAMNMTVFVKNWRKENEKDNTQSKQTGN